MCGRYLLDMPGGSLGAALSAVLDPALTEFPGTYNAAPGQYLPILTWNGSLPTAERLQLEVGLWGLIPAWARPDSSSTESRARSKGGAGFINARIETVLKLRSFRSAAAKRRCLVPMRGWYEWMKIDGAKQPMLLEDPTGSVLCVAGIYEDAVDVKTGEVARTYALLTRPASGPALEVHHRMPVIIHDELAHRWVDLSIQDVEQLVADASTNSDTSAIWRPVSKRVGNVANNDASLLETPTTAPPPESLF